MGLLYTFCSSTLISTLETSGTSSNRLIKFETFKLDCDRDSVDLNIGLSPYLA